MKIRFIAVAIAAVLLAPVLAACAPAEGNNAIVMTVDGEGIRAGEYIYYLTDIKSQIRQLDPNRAEEEFWKLPYPYAEGYNNQQYAEKIAKDRCINRVVINKKFKEMKLSLSKDDEESLNQYIKMYADSYGGDAEFNEQLRKSGLTRSLFKDMQAVGAKAQTMIDELYGPGKPQEITTDELKKYFLENYVRIKHVLIKTTDSSGNKLPDDKLAEAKAKADDILARAQAGEDFDKMSLELSEDPGSKSYPDGYIFTKDESYVQEFKDAAFEMAIGEIRMIETTYGYHIMKKYSLDNPPSLFDIKRDAVFSEVSIKKFEELFDQWVKEVKVEETPAMKDIRFEFVGVGLDTTTPTPAAK